MRITKSFSIAISGAVLALLLGYILVQGDPRDRRLADDETHMGRGAHVSPEPAQPGILPAPSPDVIQAAKTIRIAIAPNTDGPPEVYRFRKDENVDFFVSVPYDGTLAIHGYIQEVSVLSNREIKLPLKVSHTGRFPMHVHVSDGRHIEIAFLEILPE